MLRPALRRALVAVTATVLSQVVAAAPSAAYGFCGYAKPFAAVATGRIETEDYVQWWQTVSAAGTRLRVTATSYSPPFVEAWDAECRTRLCESRGTSECYISGYTGLINIAVGNRSSVNYSYLLTATPNGSSATAPHCSDRIDNDLNGDTDYPDDAGCSGPDDTAEVTNGESCSTELGLPACVVIYPGVVKESVTVSPPFMDAGPVHVVYGSVDVYSFPLPTGGSLRVPCVVVRVDASPNGCQTAGGTYVDTIATLSYNGYNEPRVGLGSLPTTVQVCSSYYTITVREIGVQSFPAPSLC